MMNHLMEKNFSRNESRPGIFAEYTYSPSNVLSIVPGARVDFHNLYGTFFTPRLHIKYNIDEIQQSEHLQERDSDQ